MLEWRQECQDQSVSPRSEVLDTLEGRRSKRRVARIFLNGNIGNSIMIPVFHSRNAELDMGTRNPMFTDVVVV